MTQAFSFAYGPRLRAGAGCTSDAAELLPDGPVLLVTDRVVRDLGLADALMASHEKAGRRVVWFDAVEADPSEETVLAAVAAGHEAGVVAVIGLGGGSPMDVAKLAAYLLGSGDRLSDIYGVGLATGARLPLLLVPTTAGTGSEATPISIVTVGGTQKKGVVAPSLYADWALLDGVLTLGLPAHVTAATGIDAIVHALEAFTSARLKNPLSDILAKEALRLLTGNLRAVVANGADVAARDAMLLGSHLAGAAFANAPVAGVHALAYPLGGRFHVPHGLSNALMLRPVLQHNLNAALPLYAELGVVVEPALEGLGQQAQAQGLLNALVQLAVDCGVPQRLAEVGVASGDLDMLADDAMQQTRLLVNNPCEISRDDARRLYEAVL